MKISTTTSVVTLLFFFSFLANKFDGFSTQATADVQHREAFGNQLQKNRIHILQCSRGTKASYVFQLDILYIFINYKYAYYTYVNASAFSLSQ